MERVTCGKKEPSPGSSCSVYADDELQLLYACDKGRCEYKMSVPQIVLQQNCSNAIRCVCNYALYLPNMNLSAGIGRLWFLYSRIGLFDIHGCAKI